MSRPTPPTYVTRNWPAHNEAIKRRGSLTIWFDLEMSWDAAPKGRHGRQQGDSDAARQTCLLMKVLSGMALWQHHIAVLNRYTPKMGWLPPSPDGIAMCQDGGVESHEARRTAR